jgi:hypothetical protein
MCKSCWVSNDSPSEWTPTTGRVVGLIRELYEKEPTGGPLHAALDDWNVEVDGHLTPSYSIAPYGQHPGFPDRFDERTHELCDEISALLTAMTVPQRFAALAYWEGFVEMPAAADRGVMGDDAMRRCVGAAGTCPPWPGQRHPWADLDPLGRDRHPRSLPDLAPVSRVLELAFGVAESFEER